MEQYTLTERSRWCVGDRVVTKKHQVGVVINLNWQAAYPIKIMLKGNKTIEYHTPYTLNQLL